jgi:predicted dienelactone hydrolase
MTMNRKIVFKCAVLVFIVAVAFGFGREASALQTFAPDGPYQVGVMIDHIKLADRTAPVMIWYPARPAKGATAYVYAKNFSGHAVLNAPVEKKDAPYPLINFSHGIGACGDCSVFYTENLASFGYVVFAIDHKDSAMCHIEGKPDVSIGKIAVSFLTGGGDLSTTVYNLFKDRFKGQGLVPFYRAEEATATINFALALNQNQGSPFFKMMDAEKIGATGHSFGGFTTLAIGGMPYHCENFSYDEQKCRVDNAEQRRSLPPCCNLRGERKDPMFMRDSRVKAMIALGSSTAFPDLAQASKELKIPWMIINGDSKKFEAPWTSAMTIYDNAPPPKYAVRLKKTDHMTISDLTLAMNPALLKLVLAGFRSGYPEKAQAYKDYSVAFFNLYLKGDSSKAETLRKPVNNYEEVWFQEK